MVVYTDPYFNLKQIALSGQCFRMTETGGGVFEIIAKERWLRAKQCRDTVFFFCGRQEFESCWKKYFDLETDYEAIIRKIDSSDAYLCRAAQRGKGIRILRQDLFEMIITFLISQQNNIPRIRRCIENICCRYGRLCRTPEGREYCGFPKPEALAGASEQELLECNLGYRGKYVLDTAARIADGRFSLEELQKMDKAKAQEKLTELYGVGKKVAACAALFGLHRLDAFPVDTHIRQAVEKHYPGGFPEKYREFQGVLQQYIFYEELFPENSGDPG